ncbi:MAG: hypothetical protein ACI39W_05935 [Brotaphodocola sp.]
MPFSMANKHRKSISFFVKKIVTLQVRIPGIYHKNPLNKRHGKKASLSVSAGLTLEASLVLSLLIFASVTLMLPMRILNTERKIQAALEAAGEDFSQYAYLQNVLESGLELSVPGANDFAKAFCRQLGTGIAEGYIEARVMDYADTDSVQQVTMRRSEFLEDGEWFDFILDYEIQMPFPVLGLSKMDRTARCRRRAWIGKEGMDGDGAAENDEEMVYVGKYATRYHRSRYCHYLFHDLTAVSLDEVENLRNNSGGKYHACAVCASGGSGDTVYIMPEGTSYHSSKTCTAITAYVRMVPLAEAEHLGACSYCGQ